MEQDVMKALLDAFERSDWQEMTVTVGSDRLHVSRSADGTPPPALHAPAPPPTAPAPTAATPAPAVDAIPAAAPAPTPAPAPAAAAVPAGSTVVESPSVGLFWQAPSPGAPPFVEVGGLVAAGDTVAIVEVMKLMNHVTAPVSGAVTAVLVGNGEAVEYGQALVAIEPEG